MESNNFSFQEQLAKTSQLSETESGTEMNRELNDSELDAIAGGKFSYTPGQPITISYDWFNKYLKPLFGQ